MASANQLAATVTPITIPERWHLYRYTSSAEPGELIMLTFHDWSNPSPSWAAPRTLPATWSCPAPTPAGSTTTCASPATCRTTACGISCEKARQVGTLTAYGNQLVGSVNQLAAYTASYETAFTARQSALNAAVASNAAPTAASAAAAAQAAQQFSAQLWTALANYQAYSATLAGLYSQLAVYRQYLTGRSRRRSIARRSIAASGTTTRRRSIPAPTALATRRSCPCGSTAPMPTTTRPLRGQLHRLRGLDNFQQAHYAAGGQTVQAGTGGDLLIAGSGANRRLVGGAGRDVFLFAQAAAGTVDDVLGFGTGLSADRIWLLQPGGDSAHTVGPNGVVLFDGGRTGRAAAIERRGAG